MIVGDKLGSLLLLLASFDWLSVTSAIVCAFFGHLVVQHFFADAVAEEGASNGNKCADAKQQQEQQRPLTAAEFSIQPHRAPERAVCRGPAVERRRAQQDRFSDELKMVLVLRRDLKPSELVAASWGSTAALEEVQHVRARAAEPSLSWLRAWNRIGVAKITTRVESNDAMIEVIAAASKKKLPFVGIVESTALTAAAQPAVAAAAGGGKSKSEGAVAAAAPARKLGGGEIMIEDELLKTMNSPGMEPVCIAIGPAPVDQFDGVTSELKLYH